MNRASLSICINQRGSEIPFSTIDEIRILKSQLGPLDTTGDNYVIYYEPDVFAQLDPSLFGESLIYLIKTNLPNTMIDLVINYPVNKENPQFFNRECAIVVIQLDDFIYDHEYDLISYETSYWTQLIIDAYDEDNDHFDFTNSEDPDDIDNDLDGDHHELQGDLANAIRRSLGIEEDEEDESGTLSMLEQIVGKAKSKEDSYGTSRVLKTIKNPKKQFRRHGVIVSDNKSAIKKDEKMIRAFLKEFIPGKADWVKDYREEVLGRWMKMYTIPKKVLKKLEKQYHGKHGKSHSNSIISKENAMNFTRKLLGNDSWNNPNK